MNYMTITPAYGRDYKSKAAVQADWDAGKDFLSDSGYISKRDAEQALGPNVTIHARYKGQTMIARVHGKG